MKQVGTEHLPLFENPPSLDDRDTERLVTALERVEALMKDGLKRTLKEIAAACQCSEAGASARLRDLRKHPRHLPIQRERVPGLKGERGLWRYWVAR